MGSLKEYYLSKNIKCCLTCKFIDREIFNINDSGEEPKGYDGMALCVKNKKIISPMWGTKCNDYIKIEIMTEIDLNFVKLANRWYAQILDFPDSVDELEMVEGANTLCELLDNDEDGIVKTTLSLSEPKDKNYYKLEFINSTGDIGANYKVSGNIDMDIWLCNVTKYVFSGSFPLVIYLCLRQ